MRFYVGSGVAIRECAGEYEIRHAGYGYASQTQADADAWALGQLMANCPVDDGYFGHRVHMTRVSDEDFAEIMQLVFGAGVTA